MSTPFIGSWAANAWSSTIDEAGQGGTWWASPYAILVLGTFMIHEAAWLLFNVPYMLLEASGWLSQYRIFKGPTPKMNSMAAQLGEMEKLAVGHVVQFVPMLVIAGKALLMIGFTTSAGTLPPWRTFLIQFVAFNLIEDTGFYWVHRLMHTPTMYKKFHYIHHKYDPPFSLSGELMHPVEMFLNVVIPLMVGPIVFAYFQGVHVVTLWTWMIFREMRGTDAHSNFALPFHPLRLLGLVYGGPCYHSVHHNRGTRDSNYGGYLWWDWLMNTTIHPSDERYTTSTRQRRERAEQAAAKRSN